MPPRSKERSGWKKGDKVQAKWSGSNVFYPATVLEVEGKNCKVQYDDGTIHSIKLSTVKAAAPVKSESTPRKSNQTRSRSRSSGRKPRSRSRSPARKAKTPSKSEKKPAKNEKNNSISPDISALKVKEDIKKEGTKGKMQTLSVTEVNSSRSSQTVMYSDAVKDKVSVLNTPSSSITSVSELPSRITRRQTTRMSHGTASTAETSSYSLRDRIPAYVPSKSKPKYSDDEESEEEEEEEEEEASVKPKEFSYLSFSAVVLKMIFLPLLPLFLAFACTRRGCTLLAVPLFYSRVEEFLTDIKYPFLACTVFHLCLSVFSKIPVGKQIIGFPYGPKNVTKKYRLNGFYLLLLSSSIFAGLAYYGIYMNWGLDKIKPIVVSSVIYVLLWSFVLHLRGLIHKTDAELMSNSESGFLGNFFYGHEINPVLYFGEDVKTRFIQFGLIGLVLLDMSILTKVVLMKASNPVPLVLSACFQIFMVLDYFWREETMLSTAVYTNDGVGFGFLVTVACIIPTTFALQNVFLMHYGRLISLPYWLCAALVVLFLCGYYLYVSSSNLKHSFRRNPFSPSLTDVESIPTSKKKRLIISGLWGVVRHPNYLGFIVMVLACSLTCGFSHSLPYIPLFFITLMLIHRSFKIESLCKEKYGPAWVNYTEKVRNRLIPYVF